MAGEDAVRARAVAVLRVRSTALALALLPAAVAAVLAGAVATGHAGGPGWRDVARAAAIVAVLVLAAAGGVAALVVRSRPAVSPTVPVPRESAPELYRTVRELAARLEVPAPSAVALTPDCDSWLEDRGHLGRRRPRAPRPAPVLVVGSPFLWWMRVEELRALLAPVVAGTGPAADPEVAAARRFVRGLDAAVAVCAPGGVRLPAWLRPVLRPPVAGAGALARLMLRRCRSHIAELERAVAAVSAERAQNVDYGLRIVAQEQVGLAYAGWDRLLTRVALPAWRMGRWPSRLDAGVVAALTELSRRDRLAEGWETRLGERPACDLLAAPGPVDEATSLLAARIFHGGPPRPGPDWAPVSWEAYPLEVVDRTWRTEASRLHRVLDDAACGAPRRPAPAAGQATLARVLDRLALGGSDELAARLTARRHRDDQARGSGRAAPEGAREDGVGPEAEPATLVHELLPPRGGRELLADHVTAMVCCAAVDTAGAEAGLDWLDGPVLLVGGARRRDLAGPVQELVEQGDPAPLRAWLAAVGVRLEQPVRLV